MCVPGPVWNGAGARLPLGRLKTRHIRCSAVRCTALRRVQSPQPLLLRTAIQGQYPPSPPAVCSHANGDRPRRSKNSGNEIQTSRDPGGTTTRSGVVLVISASWCGIRTCIHPAHTTWHYLARAAWPGVLCGLTQRFLTTALMLWTGHAGSVPFSTPCTSTTCTRYILTYYVLWSGAYGPGPLRINRLFGKRRPVQRSPFGLCRRCPPRDSTSV